MNSPIDHFCHDLHTSPIHGAKVLVTGATGYVGGELIPELLAREYQVRAMVRKILPEHRKLWPCVEIVEADALEYDSLKNVFDGIYCAYYLMHSLHFGGEVFTEMDNRMAANFRKAAEENDLRRIIYLGGLGNPKDSLSEHLMSRIQVARELKKGKTPVTFLKAAVIIGSGSASYRIINQLTRKCPVFFFPRQANSRCQPIDIQDVIRYLVGCLENAETTGKSFDIGGREILPYIKMLQIHAKVMGRKRLFFLSNFTSIKTCIYIANMISEEPFKLIKSLMESCAFDVVCRNNTIRQLIPLQPLSYTEAIKKVMLQETCIGETTGRKKTFLETGLENKDPESIGPPSASKNIFSDMRYFLLSRPKIPTLIKFNSKSERENYSYRILQRLNIGVKEYKILNIHKIGVNAPVKYVFEELLKWNGDSSCWPNHIAKVHRENNKLENLNIHLFGWRKYPSFSIKNMFSPVPMPLFELDVINFQTIPESTDTDNARYLLYKCSGGYPIGVFTIYVRSSIQGQKEPEQAQLFLMVGFNFYGKEKWSNLKLINKAWELIHNRVTSNVLNRIKQLSEWRFGKIQNV